jgi:hypothetical protein
MTRDGLRHETLTKKFSKICFSVNSFLDSDHIMVYIFNQRNNLFSYTICLDPNGLSSGVFSYISFTIELQR